MTGRILKSATRNERKRTLPLLFGVSVASVVALAAHVQAQVVINEVFSGGGTSTASVLYQKDWIELYNTGMTAFDLSTYSLNYASAANAFNTTATNRFEFPSGTFIQPNNYLLITCATPGSAGAELLADLTTTNMLLSASAGKIRLIKTADILASSQAFSGTGVLDAVGFGTNASLYEGAGRAPSPGLTASFTRSASHADTNDNAADFTLLDTLGTPAQSPTPTRYTAPTAIIGDVNLDGVVDQLDLNAVNEHWQQAGGGLALGDANQDGVVDQLDLNAVNEHWQQTSAPRGGLSVVPEPTSLGLLAVGSLTMLTRRRRNVIC